MTLTIHDQLLQGSPEWHDVRRGLVTASVVGKLLSVSHPGAIDYSCQGCGAKGGDPCVSLSRTKPTPIKTFHNERTRTATAHATTTSPIVEVADNDTSAGLTMTLVAERIAGWTEDTPITGDMWRGTEAEPFARDVYSAHYQQAEEVGFMHLEEDDWQLGYSPDGLVGVDGLIEIKAPRAKTHLKTILADEVPAFYMPQLQAGLLVSGRAWIDFVSFVGGMPLFVKRVYPDPAWHEAITAACIALEQTATATVADYRNKVAGMPNTDRLPNLNELGLVF